MGKLEIQQSIMQALSKMSLAQQYKLLEFINAMLVVQRVEKPKGILQFAGIFDASDTKAFEAALKDCEQIEKDEW
jgi:hypothetical protein